MCDQQNVNLWKWCQFMSSLKVGWRRSTRWNSTGRNIESRNFPYRNFTLRNFPRNFDWKSPRSNFPRNFNWKSPRGNLPEVEKGNFPEGTLSSGTLPYGIFPEVLIGILPEVFFPEILIASSLYSKSLTLPHMKRSGGATGKCTRIRAICVAPVILKVRAPLDTNSFSSFLLKFYKS